jgi:hypothetical protein
MTYFRGQAARRLKTMGRHLGRVNLWLEELPWHVTIQYRRHYAKHHRFFKPLLNLWRRIRG